MGFVEGDGSFLVYIYISIYIYIYIYRRSSAINFAFFFISQSARSCFKWKKKVII
jgi:hypothetical protein